MVWEKGLLKTAKILSLLGNHCRIRTQVPVEVFVDGARLDIKSLGENLFEFDTEADKRYEILAKPQK
jgi:hypothetical protein